MVPFLLAGMSSRRRLIQWSPAEVVRWLQVLSTARERLDLLSDVLRSSLDIWNEVLQPEGEIASVGTQEVAGGG